MSETPIHNFGPSATLSVGQISPQTKIDKDNERATTTTTTLLIDSLKPTRQPNDIIKLFQEEREKIDKRGRECKQLLEQTNNVLKNALTLRDLYSYVSPKTSQLHSECKNIIQERNDLRESYEKINTTLSKKEELRGIFKRIPEIKNQVFSILNTVCQSFQARANASLGQQTELTPLDEYYSKFFVDCRRIKDLTGQLELCITSANTDELSFYLEEIYRFYVDIREQMMVPVFTKNLQKLIEKSNRNYCDLTQHACASLVRILRDEIQLFQQIFPAQNDVNIPVLSQSSTESLPSTKLPSNSNNNVKEAAQLKKLALNELLDLLCKTFYEHLRPVIIHVNHLETLTELYKLVNETMRLEVSDDRYQLTMNMLAEDIQERMVFRTEVFIQESILDYKPSHGDLAYPEKFDLVPGGELRDYQSMWYPTVQRTVLAIVYLSRVFDSLTFRELAHELVAACYKSLDLAQHLVDESHGGTKVEASLFLSKHSAILIDQLQSYGIDQAHLPPPPPLLASFNPDDNLEQPRRASKPQNQNKKYPNPSASSSNQQ